jgi:hypothetical protein
VLGDGAKRFPRIPLDWGLESQRGWFAVAPAPLEPAAQQGVVVVTRDHDDLSVGPEDASDVTQNGSRRAENASQRSVSQFEDVTEQHQPVELPQRVQQPGARSRLAKGILTAACAQVQVGDDQRAHASRDAAPRYITTERVCQSGLLLNRPLDRHDSLAAAARVAAATAAAARAAAAAAAGDAVPATAAAAGDAVTGRAAAGSATARRGRS